MTISDLNLELLAAITAGVFLAAVAITAAVATRHLINRPRHLARSGPGPFLQALGIVAVAVLAAVIIFIVPVLMDPGPSQHPDIGRPAIVDNPRR